jgi:hypothetical protein
MPHDGNESCQDCAGSGALPLQSLGRSGNQQLRTRGPSANEPDKRSHSSTQVNYISRGLCQQ